jgi:hypothetical protein
MVQLLFILGVTALLGAVDVQVVILLGPLACHRPVSHEAFFKKYASKKFLKGKLHW